MATYEALTERQGRFLSWGKKISLAADSTSNIVEIPPMVAGQRATVTVIGGTTGGKAQVTTSPKANIDAGTETWQDWPRGTVTGTYSDVLVGPVTALRFVSSTGATAAISCEVVIG
jgi:hypothetical protein